MRFIEAKFQLNKYATFSNQGSASAQLQSKFSTIDFLSTFLAKFLPAALHFLHFAKNGKKRKEENNIEHFNANCSAKCVKRSPRFNAPQTWQVLKDDGVAVEHHGVVLSKGKFHPFTTQLVPMEAFFPLIYVTILEFQGEKDFQPMGIDWSQVLHNCKRRTKIMSPFVLEAKVDVFHTQ